LIEIPNHITNAVAMTAFSYVALAPEECRVTSALPAVFDSGSGYLSTVM